MNRLYFSGFSSDSESQEANTERGKTRLIAGYSLSLFQHQLTQGGSIDAIIKNRCCNHYQLYYLFLALPINHRCSHIFCFTKFQFKLFCNVSITDTMFVSSLILTSRIYTMISLFHAWKKSVAILFCLYLLPSI